MGTPLRGEAALASADSAALAASNRRLLTTIGYRRATDAGCGGDRVSFDQAAFVKLISVHLFIR